MAARRDIREALVTELNNGVPSSGNAGHVSSDNITVERPETEEDLPALVYDDAYRSVPINGASSAPTRIERDVNGDVTSRHFEKIEEAQFSVLLWFRDENEKEACYEAVRRHFEKYEENPWPASDLHADIEQVTVPGSQSSDDADINPVRRGDRVTINMVFKRDFEDTSGEPISQVNQEVDADNDGTTDATWTTT